MIYSSTHPEFITVTCLEWKHLLAEESNKDIIVNSLRFLSKEQRAVIYGFVIMNNHFHMIWHIMNPHKREDVQRDFLRFVAQQLLKVFRNTKSPFLNEIEVNARDRKYQVWERNSLGVALWSQQVFIQKLEYIHNNPVRAGLCKEAEEYKYSSARFYNRNEKDWDFLVHYNG